MGTKRVGLARMEALMENLKRELAMSTATIDLAGINTTAQMTAGTGITGLGANVVKHSVVKIGNLFHTQILIDLGGLASASAADKVIGNGTNANAHIGQITAAVNGTIMAGRMTCLETPTTGEPDIDLLTDTVGTNAGSSAASAFTSASAIVTAGQDWIATLSANQFTTSGMATVPAADSFLYLVSSGGNTAGTYGTGKYLLEFWGY